MSVAGSQAAFTVLRGRWPGLPPSRAHCLRGMTAGLTDPAWSAALPGTSWLCQLPEVRVWLGAPAVGGR
jgi:hypothetical protein